MFRRQGRSVLPTSASLSGDAPSNLKSSTKTTPASSSPGVVLVFMCCAFVMVGGLYMRLNSAFSILADTNASLESHFASCQLANDELLGAAEAMKNKVKTLQKKYGGGASGGDTRRAREAEGDGDAKMEKALLAKIEPMQQELQALSRDLLPLMFGEPPYIVDIEVELEKTETVTIEFASDLMPYTSLHFLKQVKLGLWDGAQIARNAGHVIQAGPGDQRNHFKEAGIKSVAFQEYSEEFPHEKHTLGLAGRPGGPDFYFSIVNNVKNHGPGGQKAYNLPKEADPAFAKITAGFEVLEKIHAMPTKKGGWEALLTPIRIKAMKII